MTVKALYSYKSCVNTFNQYMLDCQTTIAKNQQKITYDREILGIEIYDYFKGIKFDFICMQNEEYEE